MDPHTWKILKIYSMVVSPGRVFKFRLSLDLEVEMQIRPKAGNNFLLSGSVRI